MEEKLCECSDKLDQLLKAFPDGDIEGHRKYHESIIVRNHEVAEFFKKLTFELVKYGLLGFIGWLLIISWKAFLQGPK